MHCVSHRTTSLWSLESYLAFRNYRPANLNQFHCLKWKLWPPIQPIRVREHMQRDLTGNFSDCSPNQALISINFRLLQRIYFQHKTRFPLLLQIYLSFGLATPIASQIYIQAASGEKWLKNNVSDVKRKMIHFFCFLRPLERSKSRLHIVHLELIKFQFAANCHQLSAKKL